MAMGAAAAGVVVAAGACGSTRGARRSVRTMTRVRREQVCVACVQRGSAEAEAASRTLYVRTVER